ncbi:hypothetical protein HanPSC8_Chr01g0034061 [Helianthus annuus]|nr:hypothetical protein HanPSC8_Chr01g0034061 [Helianthus annuus]
MVTTGDGDASKQGDMWWCWKLLKGLRNNLEWVKAELNVFNSVSKSLELVNNRSTTERKFLEGDVHNRVEGQIQKDYR